MKEVTNYHLRDPVIGILGIISLMTIQTIYSQQKVMYYLPSVLCILFYIWYGYRSNQKTVQDKTIRTQVIIGAIGLSTILLFGYIRYMFEPPVNVETIPIIYLVYLCVIAPIMEEIVYRQILYRNWLYRYDKWVGRIIVGMLFVIIHLPNTFPAYLFYVGTTICLFFVYERSGYQLITVTVVHLINNLIVAFL